ncbi:7046_t:CDS:2 [Ambispora leptoticha]|uniref:7046_t:CDS:1 n=1 Tax=Ambispora leptoticha TaxID=144679 RepID=A0A9N9A7Q9_9GLOM|nr:7046_t:CDS:2 [Ambispora leptoticha]
MPKPSKHKLQIKNARELLAKKRKSNQCQIIFYKTTNRLKKESEYELQKIHDTVVNTVDSIPSVQNGLRLTKMPPISKSTHAGTIKYLWDIVDEHTILIIDEYLPVIHKKPQSLFFLQSQLVARKDNFRIHQSKLYSDF